MDVEEIRLFAISLGEVEESFPFGDNTLVFKANNKIFLLIGLNNSPISFNVKCEPDKAIELREQYEDAILPGWHMNKKHWNTILPEKLKTALIKEMIVDSYELVSLKKKKSGR